MRLRRTKTRLKPIKAIKNNYPFRATLTGKHHYAQPVFLAPPWPEIFRTDNERQHSFEEANAEYLRLRTAFRALGYKTSELPKLSVKTGFALFCSKLAPDKTNKIYDKGNIFQLLP